MYSIPDRRTEGEGREKREKKEEEEKGRIETSIAIINREISAAEYGRSIFIKRARCPFDDRSIDRSRDRINKSRGYGIMFTWPRLMDRVSQRVGVVNAIIHVAWTNVASSMLLLASSLD